MNAKYETKLNQLYHPSCNYSVGSHHIRGGWPSSFQPQQDLMDICMENKQDDCTVIIIIIIIINNDNIDK